jgi:hypothetical protein
LRIGEITVHLFLAALNPDLASLERACSAISMTLLERVRSQIDAQLHDPTLSPASIATALHTCAELVEHGARLEAVRARPAERLGVGAKRVQDFWLTQKGTTRVDIAPGTSAVRLRSGAIIPPGERRRLGAALAAVALDDVALRLDHPALARGLHAPEGEGAACRRWTERMARRSWRCLRREGRGH